jgi:predicted Zn-dependent protease
MDARSKSRLHGNLTPKAGHRTTGSRIAASGKIGNMRIPFLLFIFAVLGIAVACSSGSARPQNGDFERLPEIQGSRIYLIPIDDVSAGQMQHLGDYYRGRFGLEIPILKAVPVPANAMDNRRNQLMAEKLTNEMRASFPELANDPKAILIGVTSQDMYLVSKNWRFAFGWRDANKRTAVVSTARMHLRHWGNLFPNSEVRLRKMVTKDIGILYYGLPQSDNPRSVLYNGILGIQELDSVSEEF